jgi:four helix bundle protein
MAMIASFRELDVYKLSRQHSRRVFMVTRSFPREEKYSLMDHIRRSSRAVNALIAEAWGRRLYRAAFINKINEALAEAMETQAWLDHALDAEYIDAQLHSELDLAWQHIGAMLNRMVERADRFCPDNEVR